MVRPSDQMIAIKKIIYYGSQDKEGHTVQGRAREACQWKAEGRRQREVGGLVGKLLLLFSWEWMGKAGKQV